MKMMDGETEDDEGPASFSQAFPRRNRAAWLCTLSPMKFTHSAFWRNAQGDPGTTWSEEKSASSLHASLLLIFVLIVVFYFLFFVLSFLFYISMLLYFCSKSMFPSESLNLQSWSWLVVCQGAWERTFRNMFRSICQDVVFIWVNNEPKQYTGFPPQ